MNAGNDERTRGLQIDAVKKTKLVRDLEETFSASKKSQASRREKGKNRKERRREEKEPENYVPKEKPHKNKKKQKETIVKKPLNHEIMGSWV